MEEKFENSSTKDNEAWRLGRGGETMSGPSMHRKEMTLLPMPRISEHNYLLLRVLCCSRLSHKGMDLILNANMN